MKDDLQKSDSCGLKSERKKILTSSTCSLACLSTNLGAFCPMVVHLPSEKSILPYFSGPRGVAILDCDSHSQAGSTRKTSRFDINHIVIHCHCHHVYNCAPQGDRRLAVAQKHHPVASPPKMMFRFNIILLFCQNSRHLSKFDLRGFQQFSSQCDAGCHE